VEDIQLCTIPPHFRCAAHTFNLVATTDAEKALKSSVPYARICRQAFSKCSDLWNKYSRSTRSADIIRDTTCISLQVPTCTRWNSYYDAVAKIRSISNSNMSKLCTQLKLSNFSSQKLIFLDEYLKVMVHLAQDLDRLQGESDCYMGILLPTILTATNRLKSEEPRLKVVKPLVKAILTGLETRFGHYFHDKEFILATVTHPKFKLEWLPIDRREEVKRDFLGQIKQLRRQDGLVDDEESQLIDVDNDDYYNFNPPPIDTSKSEMEQYLLDPSRQLSILNNYPTVKKLFLHYNTALTSSAPVERLFSSGKLILSALRNRLDPDGLRFHE
uniref:HAT C-terminal dimerisation domain-containing protein n=1 Tax=Strigamia maritima TaxID=126957 RepID=T1ILD6_STRMM